MGKKARKPITTKEPPVPTDSHAEIEDWMIRLVMPDMHPIVERLDGSIRETIPGSSTPSSGRGRTTGCQNSGGSSSWPPTPSP